MTSIRAAFVRGGTSKGLVFRREDLPARAEWDALFLSAMGSPDPTGRQLNGMGGGLSSLSKVCVVEPSSHPDADVDYTFAQVQLKTATVDYAGNCGNMSSAMAPFAITEGMVQVPSDASSVLVRLRNVNTNKFINATVRVEDGNVVEAGGLQIPGVSGTGAPIRLDFLDPAGSITDSALPDHAQARSTIEVDGRSFPASLIDVANACVFVNAADLGLSGTESPDDLDARTETLELLEALREAAAVRIGLASSVEEAAARPMVPLIAMVAPAQSFTGLDGTRYAAAESDLTIRMISNGQPHRAVPITGAVCTAAAAAIPGSLPHKHASTQGRGPLRLATPSGVVIVAATTADPAGAGSPAGPAAGDARIESASIFRTSRRLFTGTVHVQPTT